MSQIQQDIDDSKKEDAPLMNTTAGKVGDIVGTAAPALVAGPESLAGSALVGAGLGAAQAIRPRTGEKALAERSAGRRRRKRPGAGVGKVAGAVLGGLGESTSKAASVKLLQNEKIPLNVWQRTGSKVALDVDRASRALSGDAADEFAASQQTGFNQAVLKRMGINNPNVKTAIDPGAYGGTALDDGVKAIQSTMNNVASRTSTKSRSTVIERSSQREDSGAASTPRKRHGANQYAPERYRHKCTAEQRISRWYFHAED